MAGDPERHTDPRHHFRQGFDASGLEVAGSEELGDRRGLVDGEWPARRRAYHMSSDKFDQEQSKPHKLFTKEEIAELFTKEKKPFEWAPGLFGASISKERFEALIQEEVAA